MSNQTEAAALLNQKNSKNTEHLANVDLEQSLTDHNNSYTKKDDYDHVHHDGCLPTHKHHNHYNDDDAHPDESSKRGKNSFKGMSIAQRRNMIFQRNAFFIRLFTMGMPTQGYIITIFWLTEAIADYPFDYWFNVVFMTFFYIMCWISYGYATYAKPFVPPRNVPPYADPRFSSTCKTCKTWKPERSHHCSTCGRCVAKMDHHCPWIVNCVGHKNHKSFLLFCCYMGLAASIYCWRSFYYLRWSYDNGKIFEHSYIFLIWWAGVTLIITPVFLMLGGLGFYHSILAFNNSTTLDSMHQGGIRMPCIPDKFWDPTIYGVNIYDKGSFANCWDFLDKNYCFWWWPKTRNIMNEGINFTSIPLVSQMEIATKLPKITGGEITEMINKPTMLSGFNYEEYFKNAMIYCENKKMSFNGNILESEIQCGFKSKKKDYIVNEYNIYVQEQKCLKS